MPKAEGVSNIEHPGITLTFRRGAMIAEKGCADAILHPNGQDDGGTPCNQKAAK
jgi:hypothetical protein